MKQEVNVEGIERDVSQRGSSVESYDTIKGVHCLAREMLPAGLVSAQTKNGRTAGCYTHNGGKPWQQQNDSVERADQCNVFIQP